jgi:hypothetical protein
LPELARPPLLRYYEVFDFFVPPDDLIPEELRKLRASAGGRP